MEPVPARSQASSSRNIPTSSPSQSHDPTPPPLKVLSLDGGGVRVFTELLILEKIFIAMARIKGNVDPEDELMPCDYFDLIGGTSTGGLIALMLGRLRMKISVAIEVFQEISAAAFPTDRKKWKPLKMFIGGAVYDAEAFVTKIKQVVKRNQPDEDLELLEKSPNPKCRVFVCSATNHTTSTRLIRSYTSYGDHDSPYPPIRVWEAALAASAAPPLFKPMTIERPRPSMTLYEGALTGNNPIRLVVNECNSFGRGRKFQCIVSLGTGVIRVTPLKSSTHPPKVADVLAKRAPDCNTTHLEFVSTKEGRDLVDDQRYFRFSPERNPDKVELDGWERFDAITKYVEEFAIEKRHAIEMCAKTLLGLRIDTTTFSTSAQPGHAITPCHVDNLYGLRPNFRRSAASLISFSTISSSGGQYAYIKFDDEDMAEHIVDAIKEAEALLKRGSLTQAYQKFQDLLTRVPNSPIPGQPKLTCHIHLGIAECRMLASDGKTKEKEKALDYLESAEKHARKALDLKDEASRPVAQMSLLAIAIKRVEREAEPDNMDPIQVATLYGQVVEQIDLLQERISEEFGTAQARNYTGLLTRAEEWREWLKILGSD